jgi:hypothetical protein
MRQNGAAFTGETTHAPHHRRRIRRARRVVAGRLRRRPAQQASHRDDGFASAQQFVDPEVVKQHPLSSLDMARYQQVRVSDYDEGAGAVPAGENEVHQVVKISLINRNTQSERSIIDRQTWRYDPEKKRWWLESGLPDITQ